MRNGLHVMADFRQLFLITGVSHLGQGRAGQGVGVGVCQSQVGWKPGQRQVLVVWLHSHAGEG